MPDVVAFKPREVKGAGFIPSVCQDYLNAKQTAGAADNTIIAYRHDLEQFAGFVMAADITMLHDVRAMDVDNWVRALIEGEGNNRRTAARKLASVKSMFTWAVRHERARSNPAAIAEPIKFEVDPVQAPPQETIRRFLDVIDASTLEGLRDRAMFELIADSALRIGGLRSLDLFDEDEPPLCFMRTDGLILYRAKGGKIKETCATNPATLRWVEQWLQRRHGFAKRKPCAALFIARTGQRISQHQIHGRIKYWAEKAGMGFFHAHLLRHSRLGDVMQKGDVHLAQYLSGHERKSTLLDIYGTQANASVRRRLREQCPAGGA